ncbi:MAG: HesA/MoeB/ThiF family protein [Bacteroides sp.]|nr:HesA/MoeB/ThiF family protein [Bacteroides sp.]
MKTRYSRNEKVIGKIGQERLKNGSVLVIGCGALGSPAAMYLAGAGVGRIGIVDFDTIDPTNLQRQLFYREADAGKSKAVTLANRMRELNSEVEVEYLETLLTSRNGRQIISAYDFVIEATDNPSSKYLIDELCHDCKKPVTIGGVVGMRGQVTTYVPGHKRFSDFFPVPPEEQGVLPCSIEGVLGPAAGVISSIQASEAIKFISDTGTLLTDRLLLIDLTADGFSLLDY